MDDPVKRVFTATDEAGNSYMIIERTRKKEVPAFGGPHFMDVEYWETDTGEPVEMFAFGCYRLTRTKAILTVAKEG